MTIDPALFPAAFVILAVLAATTAPLAAAVFFSSAFLLLLNPAPLPPDFAMNYSLAMRLNSPALISIPLFALAGELAVASGIARRLLVVADALAGKARAAAKLRAVLGCVFFASVSGVGPAAAAAEGKRLIPVLRRAGFSREAAAGAVACAAGLAIVIPASIPLTVYAASVGMQTNIVFTASFVPGLVLAGALLVAMTLGVRGRPGDSPGPARRQGNIARLLWRARWSLLMPVLVLASLFTGFFTAPEAAAFSCVYAAIVGRYVHRRLHLATIREVMVRSATGASAILLMAGMGGMFALLMESAGCTTAIADAVYGWSGGRVGSILAINAILLAAGCFMNMPGIVTLIVPLLLPLAARCGMSPAHFGAMVVMNLAIGLVTPPQGWNLSVTARIAGTDIWSAARDSGLFLAAMLATLLLVAFFPALSTWLPGVFAWNAP